MAVSERVGINRMPLISASWKGYLHKCKELILEVEVLALELQDQLGLADGFGIWRSKVTLGELFLWLFAAEERHLPIIL